MTNRFSGKESIYLRIDDWNLFDQRLDKKSYTCIDYHGKKYMKYMSACIICLAICHSLKMFCLNLIV